VSTHPRAIHQFNVASAFGDGVTQSMLFTRHLLRQLGFDSEIFCADVAPELADEIRPMASYPDDPEHILLLHHALGHNYAYWVEALKSRLIMVYHNITPPEYFPPGSLARRYCELGREQLTNWRGRFIGAIGDSALNTSELLQVGYKNAATIPLLVNLERLRMIEPDKPLVSRLSDAFNMVFVGRVAANKCQHDLISIFAHLRRRLDVPARLLLVGGVSTNEYLARLEALRHELNLGHSLEIMGKVSDADLAAIYRTAGVFVSMSEHEGFGMPLIEAMAHDVPVIAFNSSNIADTLGGGGILLSRKDHKKTAALIKIVSEEPQLRRRILLAQRRNLLRFEHETLRDALAGFLEGIGVAVKRPPLATRRTPPEIRIEGPFDSSYSLALVNREFARALHQQRVDVALHSAEGFGDYAPDNKFLTSDAECREMWRRGQADQTASVLLRDMYPPRVTDMRAPANGLSNFAWEESGFPSAYVDAFNRSLTHITVLSDYVKKVLVDNGVRVPVSVSGAGVDHMLRIQPQAFGGDLGPDGFRFLHVSSCFSRKGADVLLEAFGRAFTDADRVSLVIKTFPNIHNAIEGLLADFRSRFPNAAPVILINADISAGEVADIYRRCDALVAPSRGEGFGLPIAEAMLFDKPVITTAHGGQMDFCTPENAWLVDYEFAYAQTHMEQFNSVWAEPDLDDLTRILREVHGAPSEERMRRAVAGKQALLTNWRWQDVADRNLQAIGALDVGAVPRDLPHVGWVTTWNVRCGIAAYARALSVAIPVGAMAVFSSDINDMIATDEENVVRCWYRGWDDTLDDLYQAIRAAGVTVVVIQFNFGFFGLTNLGRLITRLAADGVGVHIFLHATADVVRPDVTLSLRTIAEPLARATRLYVHGVGDLNRLKGFGLTGNVVLFPQGVTLPQETLTTAPVDGSGGKLIACFGYMLPDKGAQQLIEAFGTLRESHPELRLLMLNAAYPAVISDEEQKQCRTAIANSPHRDAITLVTDFLSDDEVHARLREADLIVFPYQKSGESSSAAVRFGLASGRPVACAPLSVFQDVTAVTHQLPGITPKALAAGISALLEDENRIRDVSERQAAWLAQHDWQMLSKRLWNILCSTAVSRAEE
jgi:glycosyltransferase involved in cell wall biosynthesis